MFGRSLDLPIYFQNSILPAERSVERLNRSSASTRRERSRASNCRTISFSPHSFKAVATVV